MSADLRTPPPRRTTRGRSLVRRRQRRGRAFSEHAQLGVRLLRRHAGARRPMTLIAPPSSAPYQARSGNGVQASWLTG